MPPYSLRRLLWVGPVVTLAAILVNLSYYGVIKALGGQYLLPLDENSSHLVPMPVFMPVVIILITGLLATILFGLLIRFVPRPATVFLSVSVTALILSFGGPFNLPTGNMSTKILLSGMHVIAAAIITGGLLFLGHKDAKPEPPQNIQGENGKIRASCTKHRSP
jgi:putative copper export protein